MSLMPGTSSPNVQRVGLLIGTREGLLEAVARNVNTVALLDFLGNAAIFTST